MKRHEKCKLSSTRFPGPGEAECRGFEVALAHRPVLASIDKPPQPMLASNGAV